MTSGQLIKESEITRDTLRHYVSLGLISPEKDINNGYQIFTSGDVEIIKFIKQAQSLGFSLSEIKDLASHMVSSTCKHQSLLPYLRDQVEAVEQKIHSLERIRNHLMSLVQEFEDKDCEKKPEELTL